MFAIWQLEQEWLDPDRGAADLCFSDGATVWTTDWYELYYYDDRQLIDYIYYWAGLLVYVSRVAAWSKLRWARD